MGLNSTAARAATARVVPMVAAIATFLLVQNPDSDGTLCHLGGVELSDRQSRHSQRPNAISRYIPTSQPSFWGNAFKI